MLASKLDCASGVGNRKTLGNKVRLIKIFSILDPIRLRIDERPYYWYESISYQHVAQG
jgi:hypothetical protein